MNQRTIGLAVVFVGAAVLLAGVLLAGVKFISGSGSELPPPESVDAMESAIDQARQILQDPEVIEAARSALAGGGAEALRRPLRSAGADDLIDAQVYSPPLEDIALGSYPEPDFAVLHMLIEARRQGLAPAEVHYSGTANENLVLAAAVPEAGIDADAPAGFLLVRLPVSVIVRRIGAAPDRQWLALQQDDSIIASAGELPEQLEADNEFPLAGSRLRLLTGRTGVLDGIAYPMVMGVAVGGVLLLLIGLWVWRKPDSPAVAAEQPEGKTSAARTSDERGPVPEGAKAAEPKQDLPDWMLDEEQAEEEDGPFAEMPKPVEQQEDSPAKSTQGGTSSDESLLDVPDLDTILEQIESEGMDLNEESSLPPDAELAAEDEPEVDLDESDDGLLGEELDLDDEDPFKDDGPIGADEGADAELDEVEEAPAEDAPDKERVQAQPDNAEDDDLDFTAEQVAESPTGDESDQASEASASELDLDFAFSSSISKDEGGTETPEESEPEPTAASAGSQEPELPETAATEDAPEDLQSAVEAPGGLYRPGRITGTFEQNLTAASATAIGRALGAMLHEAGHGRIAVARDGRVSGPILLSALIRGLRNSGINVIEAGAVPTPLLWFAAAELADGCAAMVTASHEPAERNGFLIRIGGRPLDAASMKELARRVEQGDVAEGGEEGDYEQQDIRDRYAERLSAEVQLERSIKVVIDCGNGIGGTVVPELADAIGADLIPLYCDVDGSFPNHLPDPSSSEALEDLRLCVRNFHADLGIAFDGDADRLVLVTNTGEIVWADRMLMLLARDVLGRHPGASVVFDACCSGHLTRWVEQLGGQAAMTAVGELALAEKLQALEAPLGGAWDGHVIVADGWYDFGDAIHTAARLMALFAADTRPADEIVAELPEFKGSPELAVLTDSQQSRQLIDRLAQEGDFGDARLTRVGGVRVDWENCWGLARVDVETGHLLLRFGGDDAAALGQVRSRFRDQLLALEPTLELPY
jgi:phosphomannomutase / phosphoglucomutase